MIYMSRLGIWGEGTPFRTFDDFLHAIEKRFVFPRRHCLARGSRVVFGMTTPEWENAPRSIRGACLASARLSGSVTSACFHVRRGVGAMEIVAMDMKVSGMYIARQLSFSGVSFRIEEIGLDSDFKLVYNKAARLVGVLFCCARVRFYI